MKVDSADLVQAAKLAARRAVDRHQQGEIPAFLGTDGMVALMYDKIRRYRSGWGSGELVDLASDALVLAALVLPSILEEEKSSPEEEQGGSLEETQIYCPWCEQYGPVAQEFITATVEICSNCADEHTLEEYESWVEKMSTE